MADKQVTRESGQHKSKLPKVADTTKKTIVKKAIPTTTTRSEKRKIQEEDPSRSIRRRTRLSGQAGNMQNADTPLPEMHPAAAAAANNAHILGSPNPPPGNKLKRSPLKQRTSVSKTGSEVVDREHEDRRSKGGRTSARGDDEVDEDEDQIDGISPGMNLMFKKMKGFFKAEFGDFRGSFGQDLKNMETRIDDLSGSLTACDKKLEKLNAKVDSINVREEVEEALEERQGDFEDKMKETMRQENAKLMNELEELKKRQERLEAEQEKVAGKDSGSNRTNTPGQSMSEQRDNTSHARRYWFARRCLKMWKVSRNESTEANEELVEHFIHETLQVERRDFNITEQVEGVRKLRSGGSNNNRWEILVIFTDVGTRDFIYSHARHLAGSTDMEGKRTAGIKMEIPVHLLPVFRTLEKHGHILKQRSGAEMKRQIMYDDDEMSLYLDVKITRDAPWQRVMPSVAKKERMIREEREGRKAKKETNTRTTSTIDTDTDSSDDQDTGSDIGAGEPEGGEASTSRGNTATGKQKFTGQRPRK